jgi:hypothetical protein
VNSALWSASENVIEVNVVHDLDALASAILYNGPVQQVSVASAQDIDSAESSGLHNWIIIRVGDHDPVWRRGQHNLRDIAHAADELSDRFLAQVPTRL